MAGLTLDSEDSGSLAKL